MIQLHHGMINLPVAKWKQRLQRIQHRTARSTPYSGIRRHVRPLRTGPNASIYLQLFATKLAYQQIS